MVNALRRLVGRHHRLAAMLVLIVLAARLLVPAGFMPVAGGGALTICGGTMPVAVATHHHGDAQPAPVRDGSCAFVVAATPALAAAAPLLPIAPPIVPTIKAPLRDAALALPARALRPPSRGPPVAA